MKKNVLFIYSFVFFCSFLQKQIYAQNRIVELEIIGDKTYNNLYIQSWDINFDGKTINGYQWTFEIPDSIVKKAKSFSFRSSDLKPPMAKRTMDSYIAFLGVIMGDTLRGTMLNFDKEEMHIRLKMEYYRTVHEFNYQYIPSLDSIVAIQEWYEDQFLVINPQNCFLKENMITPYGFFFYDTEKYDDFLTEFAAKIKENPNSLYYMSGLASTFSRYKSKKDVEYLYYLFSDEMQHSYLGQIVHDYIRFNVTW